MNGERVVITRARSQAADLQALLIGQGATTLLYPCIAFQLQASPALDSALEDAAAGCFDWLVFTSANAAQAVSQRAGQLGLKLERIATPLAAVGPATARAVRRALGRDVQVMPEEYLDRALVAALGPLAGQQVLVLQTEQAARLTQQLSALQAIVRTVATCQVSLGHGGVALAALIERGQVDAVTLTSPSIVHNFVRRLQLEQLDLRALDPICLACIGPTTAQAAREQGLPVSVVPGEYTIDGLVAALAQYFAQRPASQRSVRALISSEREVRLWQ